MAFQTLNLMPFTSYQNGTIAVTDVSAAIALGSQGDTVLLQNDGGATVYVALGDGSVAATAGGTATAANTGGLPMLAGAIFAILCAPGITHIAAICDTGLTTTLRVSRGKGQ